MTQTSAPSTPCPCGSGRKYKKCCMPVEGIEKSERDEEKRILVRRAEGTTLELLVQHVIKLEGDDFFNQAAQAYAADSEDIALPDEDSSSTLAPFSYCFHLYAVLNYPYLILEDTASKSFAEFLLNESPALFRKDQIQFIKAALPEPMRWLLVSDIQNEAYITLTDIEHGDTFEVRDLGLATSGVRGMLLLAQVIKMWGNHYLLSAFPRCLPGDWAGQLISHKEEAKQRSKRSASSDADKIHCKLIEDHLQRAIYYHACQLYLEQTASPRLQNTDGELMEPRVIEYALAIPPKTAWSNLLKSSKQFKPTDDEAALDLIWYGARPKRDPSDVPYIRGIVKFSEGKIIVEVNSEERAQKLCRLIEKALDDEIGFVDEKLVESSEANSLGEIEEMPPEVAEMMQKQLDSYYQNWVNEKIPALGNLTPRQAAKDPKMKNALEALFVEFERRADIKIKNAITPDVKMLRAMVFKDDAQ